MHDPRINTYAALAIVMLFGLGALLMVVRAIERIDWAYASLSDVALIAN